MIFDHRYHTMPSDFDLCQNGSRILFVEFHICILFQCFSNFMSARQLARLRALIEEKKRLAEAAAEEEEYDEDEEEYEEEYEESNKVSFSVGF